MFIITRSFFDQKPALMQNLATQKLSLLLKRISLSWLSGNSGGEMRSIVLGGSLDHNISLLTT
jgi:hypothetical protein